jgi:hypothetical protein
MHGHAASGKSVLTSFIINHLVESGLPCHYFFVRFASSEKRSVSMILRSLAHQLAQSTPAYAENIRRLEAAGTNLRTADYWTLWQLLFVQALFKLNQVDRPLYLIIDGIDEADQPAAVIKQFTDLRLTPLPIRLLVVGRNTHETSLAFQKLAKLVDTETIRIDGNTADFRAYIDHELEVKLAGDTAVEVPGTVAQKIGNDSSHALPADSHTRDANYGLPSPVDLETSPSSSNGSPLWSQNSEGTLHSGLRTPNTPISPDRTSSPSHEKAEAGPSGGQQPESTEKFESMTIKQTLDHSGPEFPIDDAVIDGQCRQQLPRLHSSNLTLIDSPPA